MPQPTSLDRHHPIPTQQPDIMTTVTVSWTPAVRHSACNVEQVSPRHLKRFAAVLERRLLSTHSIQLTSWYKPLYDNNFRSRRLSWAWNS
ncbi:hypothetical protein J6590_092760 [Homalodisca vitripennis]|nr:hypothetical protein J6590_092760 [Homalodisca vitripennis]